MNSSIRGIIQDMIAAMVLCALLVAGIFLPWSMPWGIVKIYCILDFITCMTCMPIYLDLWDKVQTELE